MFWKYNCFLEKLQTGIHPIFELQFLESVYEAASIDFGWIRAVIIHIMGRGVVAVTAIKGFTHILK